MILFVAFVVVALAGLVCVAAATAGDGRAARRLRGLRSRYRRPW